MNTPTFADAATMNLGCPRTAEFFAKCERFIPWRQLADSVADVFAADEGRGGRPHYPVVMLLKCLMLAKWFGLSDPDLEGMLLDRMSFRRFVGLGMSDDTPDETTFVTFRRRLREAGHAATLFDQALDHLRGQGLVLNEGTLVDATIIEAPKGKTTDDGWGHTRDKAASYTKNHGRTYHGYKAHIATDTQGVITDYVFDTAKAHDSRHIDQLIGGETSGGAVFADGAYMDQKRKARLEGDGVFCGIIERRVRGQDELTPEQVEHNRLCAAVRAIVEHPFAWMKNMGYRVARYRGLARNACIWLIVLAAACVTGKHPAVAEQASAPVFVAPSPANETAVVRLPGGELKLFTVVEGKHCASMTSTNNGMTWSELREEFKTPATSGYTARALVDRDGEVHICFLVSRGVKEGNRDYGIDLFWDIWHARTIDQGAQWTEPKRIFQGYVGALRGFIQLDSGRLVLPFGEWMGDRPLAPPTGANEIAVLYSDDGGETWSQSPSRLTVPSPEGGYGIGACEPTVIQLKDGRLWMLIRTETGHLYESFSSDKAVNWSDAQPSRFTSSESPACLLRLPDERIVLIWNNCLEAPAVDGQKVYSGRDALHAAISEDEGVTWRGFREVYRDPKRNEPPPEWGDRGTSYPNAAVTTDGKVVLVSGQGDGRRQILLFDPDGLYQTKQTEDFSDGLEQWCVFKGVGPVKRYWRDRVAGAQLVDHPTRPQTQALHLRRPDRESGDGAVWNFAIGRKGQMQVRLMLRSGFGGGHIALGDRFFFPTDDTGESRSAFSLPIHADGRLGHGPVLEPDRWHLLGLTWDSAHHRCEVALDGKLVLTLPQAETTLNGISYLRLRSTAPGPDSAGWLIDMVSVEVEDPWTEPRPLGPDLPKRLRSRNDGTDRGAHIISPTPWFDPRVVVRPELPMGPFVHLDDQRVLTIDGDSALISDDDGVTWQRHQLASDDTTIEVSNERALVRTRDGVIVLVFMNMADDWKWEWNKATNAPSPDTHLDVWSIRSRDGGKTWEDLTRVFQGYCGAVRDMIATRNGRLVVPINVLLHDAARHATKAFVSDDQGKSWGPSNLIDIGGRGHHDGAFEGTLVELQDRRLWMLLRSNLDRLWSAYSDDDGLNWRQIGPSQVDASSSPALLTRLASGRLVLVWNRLFPQGTYVIDRRDGQASERSASWQREELSIAFSNDEGRSWTEPQIIARSEPGGRFAYPYVFERLSGALWITTMQGNLRIELDEHDFVAGTDAAAR